MIDTRMIRSESGSETAKKLIGSTILAWGECAGAKFSARHLAEQAGLPAASIYYHFSSFEHLLESAQRAALAQAEQWCATQLAMIPDEVGGASAFSPLLAGLIDGWCEEQRALAFACNECQLLAARAPKWLPIAHDWRRLWRGFWTEVCSRFGLGDVALATTWLFDGEVRFHLSRWRRPVDRAALDELCAAWTGWLDGRLGQPSPWRDYAGREANNLMPPERLEDLSTCAIAAAAAAIIEQQGIGGLTHRAVAAQAGIKVGPVSYKYRTVADLLLAAFEVVYRRARTETQEEIVALRMLNRDEMLDWIGHQGDETVHACAFFELMIAAARDPSLGPFVVPVRYSRGRATRFALEALTGRNRKISRADAALLSSVINGYIATRLCDADADIRALLPVLARLDALVELPRSGS